MASHTEDDTGQKKAGRFSFRQWTRLDVVGTRSFKEPAGGVEIEVDSRRRGTAPAASGSNNTITSPSTSAGNVHFKRQSSLRDWLVSRAAAKTKDELLNDQDVAAEFPQSVEDISSRQPIAAEPHMVGHTRSREEELGTAADAIKLPDIEAIIERHTPDGDSTLEGQSYSTEYTGSVWRRAQGSGQDVIAEKHLSLPWAESSDDGQSEFKKLQSFDDQQAVGKPDNKAKSDTETEHPHEANAQFLSATMGLTVEINDPSQQPDGNQWPASPCSGVILETSPRYGTLQTFRKDMSMRGIDVQVGNTIDSTLSCYCCTVLVAIYFNTLHARYTCMRTVYSVFVVRVCVDQH